MSLVFDPPPRGLSTGSISKTIGGLEAIKTAHLSG